MENLNREAILRMLSGKTGNSSSGGGGGDIDLAGYATMIWVTENFVSIDFFRELFRAYDSNSQEIQPNDTTSVVASIKAMVGTWTEEYLTALGNAGGGGGGGGGAQYLNDLLDVELTTPLTDGQALVYNATLQKWVNGSAGVNMTTVWNALAGSTNEQINASHLSTALSGYVTTSDISDMATRTWVGQQGFATQTWVTSNFITIAYFDRLFRAYNDSTLVSHNDTTSTIDNIKAMFGFWTDFYLSALGTGGVSSVSISLSQLADVNVAGVTNGQVLSYNSTNAEWVPTTISNVTSLSALTDVALSSPTTYQVLMYDASTTKWYNSALKTINGQPLYGSGDISVGGGASGNYLPLSGGTLTGNLFMSNQTYIQLDTTSGSSRTNYISAGGGYSVNAGKNGLKLIAVDQSDALIGIGADLLGGPGYDTCIVGSTSQNSNGTISFMTHIGITTSYQRLARFYQNGNDVHFDLYGYMNIECSRGEGIDITSSNTYSCITYKSSTSYKWACGCELGHYYFYNTKQGAVALIDDDGNFYNRDGCYIRLGMAAPGSAGTNNNSSYVSCGPGYSVNSGRYGLRFLVCDQSDAQTGLGQDLVIGGGYSNAYNLCAVTGVSSNGYGAISFVYHSVNSISYSYMGGFISNGGIVFYVAGNVYATGAVTALSDIRHKTVIKDAAVSVEDIARMPAVMYQWNDGREDKEMHVGSIAQDWQTVLPEVVLRANDEEGTLSMQYGVAALVSSIIISRKVVNHEERIKQLEKENKELKERLNIA